jgi:hypothetical protein
MASKDTRGRPSSIDTLPDDIRQVLDSMLVDKGVTQQAILKAVNQLLDEAGVEKEISKSSLNRYATRMAKVGSRLADMREVASMWTSKLGDAPTGDVGKLLIETLNTLAFETTMAAADGDEPVSPGMIKELALSIMRLQKAEELSTKNEKEIRKAFAQETAKALDEAVAKQENKGLTAETVASIKADILGI